MNPNHWDRGSPYVVGTCSVIFAFISISVGIELLVATVWSEAAEAMKKAGGRAYKGPKK
jgi:hypothetical protein